MSKRPGPDNFEVVTVNSFRGYISDIDPTLAPPDCIVRGSQNVYKTADDTWANRPGRKQFDVVDATLAGTKAAYVWATSLGENRILAIANDKLEVISDIAEAGVYTHYTLMSSLATTRGVFDSWWNNTLKKDQLLFVIGDDNLYMWHGGMGLIASTTANTIVLTSTIAGSGFSTASGSVLVNGTTYTYTGSSGSTLTGVTPNPTSEANGSVVISTVITSTNTPAVDYINDFIRVINNRLHVGSYTSRLIYISSQSDYTNFTVPATRAPGDPELLTLDGVGKGIGVRGSSLKGNAHIFGGSDSLYVVTYEKITVGSTLTEQTFVEKRNLGLSGAAYAHEFIDSLGDTIVWLSQDQQVRTMGNYSASLSLQFPILSNELSTDLVNTDFTLGQLKIIGGGDKGDIIYLIAPNTGAVYMYRMRDTLNKDGVVVSERLWQAPFVWGISRIDSIGSDVIGFSNSNPQIYTLWDTLQWHDDSPSGSLAYTSIFLTSYRGFGRRQGKFRFDKVYWEGYMTPGTVLNGVNYYDYQGATGLLAYYIHSVTDSSPATDASFFTGVIPPSLGDSSLGDNPLGDATAVLDYTNAVLLDHDLLPKFKIIVGLQVVDFFEVAFMCFTSREDDRFELIAMGANATESPSQAVEIIKRTS